MLARLFQSRVSANGVKQSPPIDEGRWLTCTGGAGTGVVATLLAMTNGPVLCAPFENGKALQVWFDRSTMRL